MCHRAKWDPLSPEFAQTVPVLCQLDRDTEAEVVRAATNAFAALGCRDYGRVDLRLTAEGRPYVIDVNPNCDLHPKAGYAVAAAAAGVGYEELVGRLVELAFRRGGHR